VILQAIGVGIGLAPSFILAGTHRDDVPDSSFTALGNDPNYNTVGTVISTVSSQLYGGAGVLIGSHWLLTAAHLVRVDLTGNGAVDPSAVSVNVNGQSQNSDEWVVHPSYQDNLSAGFDLALLHLSTPVTSVTPSQLYTGSSELTADGVSVGFGHGGTGSTGEDNSFGTKRAGHNTIDSLGGVFFPDVGFLASNRYLVTDFDSPTDATRSSFGSSTPVPLEFLPAHGDSGGPVFINDGGVQKVAGIISVGDQGPLNSPDGTINSSYGDVAAAVRTSVLNGWITDQMSALYWSNSAGGTFGATSNWDEGSVPGVGNIAVFDIGGVYSVSVTSAISNKRIRVRAGNVTMNLGGNTYTLGSSTLENSLSVAKAVTDNCSLTLSGGTMSAVNVGIAEISGTTGQLTIGSGGVLQASSGIYVGGTSSSSGGTATLQINSGGAVQINNGMQIYFGGKLNNSGTASWAGGTIVAVGPINNMAGAIFDSQGNLSLVGAGGAFSNAGLLRKSSGTGLTTVSTPLTNTGTVQVQSGSMSFMGGGSSSGGTFLVASSTRMDIAGSSAFTMSGQNTATGSGVVGLGSLVSNSGTFKVDTNAIVIASGTLNNTGTVNLNNRLILDYNITSPIVNIRNQIKTGFASGAWNGSGIASSSAATIAATSGNIHKTGIGFGEASTLNLTSFGGQTVDSTSLLLRYTYFGDANLDGTVNLNDFNLLAANFGKSSQFWSGGDFNYDGTVNALDLNAIATNFGQVAIPSEPVGSALALGALVPEPVALAPVGMAVMAMARRRRARLG
jgi:hypothetical protein